MHFFGGAGRTWDGVAGRLRAVGVRVVGVRVVAPDLRGFGGAADAPGPYAVDDYAADVVALAAAEFDAEPWLLVGHSMGAKVAVAAAARRPAGLAGLVLVAPSPPSPEPMADDERTRLLAAHGDRAAARTTIAKASARAIPPETYEQLLDDEGRAGADAWRAWLESGSREDRTDRAEAVRAAALPTHVMGGADDGGITPAVVRRIAVALGIDAERAETVAGAGHLLPVEAAAEVAAAILRMAGPPAS